jgi:hypothetical protein
MGDWWKWLLQPKRALFLLLNRFLYAAILITTYLQYASDTEPKKELPSTPESLMMSVAATPLSIYLKK